MKLFEPGKIGRLSVKNRIAMAPMGIMGLTESDGKLSQRAIDYYVARAKGGTGLIITCALRVSRETEQSIKIPFCRLGMVDDKMYGARLNELAEAVHDYGAKIAVQLTAGIGRVAKPPFSEGRSVAPSAIP